MRIGKLIFPDGSQFVNILSEHFVPEGARWLGGCQTYVTVHGAFYRDGNTTDWTPVGNPRDISPGTISMTWKEGAVEKSVFMNGWKDIS